MMLTSPRRGRRQDHGGKRSHRPTSTICRGSNVNIYQILDFADRETPHPLKYVKKRRRRSSCRGSSQSWATRSGR